MTQNRAYADRRLFVDRAFMGSVFGGLFGGLLPWQKVAMDQQMMLGAQAGVYGKGIAQEIMERSAQMQRDMMNIGLADRRPKKVWAYWQFKNGKIAPLKSYTEITDMDWDFAWDRSLGAYVCYAN